VSASLPATAARGDEAAMKQPFVSLIIPCRNEERFIAACLDSVLANDFPKEQLEVLVVDGASEDRTREIVREYAARYPLIRLLNNPKKVTPAALNVGIRHARGDIIARLDAHSTLEPQYLSKCLRILTESGADNVGGMWRIRAREDTPIGRAIARVLAHPLGAGSAYYRTGTAAPRLVDTVPFGFYTRDVFERIGLFNEDLVRGQDMELNLRLIRAGGKILLDPEIESYYYARSDLAVFFKHNFADGLWVTYALKFAKLPVSWRHLVPLCFVAGLGGSLALAPAVPPARGLFGWIVGLYAAACGYGAVTVAARERRPEYALTMPIAFATRHVGYGLGSCWGVVKLLAGRPARKPAPRLADGVVG
jgi:glycosyltransferase involved in cell wall biosynthesis